MDAVVKNVVREMSRASDQERIAFPEVVKALMEVGVERYHADLVAGRKTYYLPGGDFEEVEVHKINGAATTFSAAGVEKAVRAIQRQEIAYREFSARSPTRAASAILSASPDAARSIMAEPGTSTWNGFPALSRNTVIAIIRGHSPKGSIPCSTHPAIRRHERLL
jgi:uncharacterized protein YbcV (DUF1398 family)